MDSVCIGPIAYTGQAELERDIANFKAALKGVKVEEAFLPVAAERIIRYARLLGRENVLAGTDCGFAQGPFYRTLRRPASCAGTPDEWKVWKDVKLPAGKVLVPGVISHATNVVEHPELVARPRPIGAK